MAEKLIAKNPAAGHHFILSDNIEAGVELEGSEVKSLRSGKANMKDAFARLNKGQVWLHGVDISPYPQAGPLGPEPKSIRRLLLHKSEIKKLEGKLTTKGFTLVATRLYFKDALVKVELALGKGKQLYDKREKLKKRQTDRDVERELKKRR